MNRETRKRKWFPTEGPIGHVREVFLIIGAYFVYMLIRRYIISDIETVAFANAVKVVSFELSTGIFWEQRLQAWAIENSKALIVFLNWSYIITFFPIIAITAVVVYVKNRPRYRYYRDVVLLSFVFALILFAVFPLAPPRFIPEYGFVDAIQSFGPSWYGGRDMASAVHYNVFAAMPSLHFGWTVLFAVLFFRSGPVWLKIVGVMYPVMTFLAITLTGNHYMVDAAGGAAVALASYLMYEGMLHLKLRAPSAQAVASAQLRGAGVYAQGILLRWTARSKSVFANVNLRFRLNRLSDGKWKTAFFIYRSLPKGKRI